MSTKRVAVIGAGIYGVAALRHLSEEPDVDVVCFEKRPMTGGLWNFEDSPDAQPYLCPIYKNLRCNIPRILFEYPDKPMDINWSWPDHEDVAKYVQLYSKENGLDNMIRFNTEVVSVQKIPKEVSDGFLIKSKAISGIDVKVEEFDCVVVASGYHGKPVMPVIKSEVLFKGEILHSWKYREPEVYTNKRVLLVGSNISAWDIAWELSPHVAEVLISHHEETMLMTLPKKGRAIHSGVKRFTQNGVVLENGENIKCDVVIYCTGYIPDFSFLDESCQTNVTAGRVENLYKMIVHTKVPSLYFIGMCKYAAIMKVAACQAKFIGAVITGKATLPCSTDMEKELENEFEQHIATGQAPRIFHYLAWHGRKYCKGLEYLGGFEPIPNVLHNICDRVFDLALKEKKYIESKKFIMFDVIDDENFTETNLEEKVPNSV